MTKSIGLFCLMIIFTSVVSKAQENFQGIVEVKITNSRSETNDVKLYTKGDALKLVAEEDMKNGNFLINDGSIYILMPEEKKYVQMPLNVNNKVKSYSEKADNLKRTGETKEILGYQAEKWEYEENGTFVEVWNTKDLGNILNVTNFIPDAANETWYKDGFSEGFFPLSITITNENRNTVNKFEVTDIEKKELDDEEFNLPDDFEKMQTSKK